MGWVAVVSVALESLCNNPTKVTLADMMVRDSAGYAVSPKAAFVNTVLVDTARSDRWVIK